MSRARDRPVELEMVALDPLGGDGPDAYHRLIADAIVGDERLFARQDGVEEAWRIVAPMLAPDAKVLPYAAGTWGPEKADEVAPRR